MKAESNWFDNVLKQTLRNEIIYRISLWVLFPLCAFFIDFIKKDISASQYLLGKVEGALPFLNILFIISVFILLISLCFKYMEKSDSAQFSPDKLLGRFGAFFRRFSSDVFIWMSGALINVIIISAAILIIALYKDIGLNSKDLTAIILLIFILSIAVVFCIYSYWIIRKEIITNFLKTTSALVIGSFYFLALLFWFLYLQVALVN